MVPNPRPDVKDVVGDGTTSPRRSRKVRWAPRARHGTRTDPISLCLLQAKLKRSVIVLPTDSSYDTLVRSLWRGSSGLEAYNERTRWHPFPMVREGMKRQEI